MTTDIQIPGRAACLKALSDIYALEPVPPGAAIMVHLRTYKSFSETFGYRQGNEMLRDITEFLSSMPGAEVYRYGASFYILLRGSDCKIAMSAAQQIAVRFEQPWKTGAIDCLFSVDIGIAPFPEYAKNPDSLLHNLDLAAGYSGKIGFNQVTVFDAVVMENNYRRSIIAKLLGNATAGGDIEIRYRPVFNSEKNRYTRAECRARLLTLEFGPVKAEEFDPIAEENGIICFVNRYVIERTCGMIRELMDDGIEFETIMAPVSPVLFVQDGFVRDIAAMLERYGIPGEKLSLEIRNSPMISSCARSVLDSLHDLKIELALSNMNDDESGMRDILTLPVDVYKLKRQFVWQLETNPRGTPVIEGIIRMMRKMGVKLIAEGVETEAQNSLLMSYHCPYCQGLYYSAAVTGRELSELLR